MIDEPFVAHLITLVVRMLAAIKLHNQSLFAANEVDDVRPDRYLANELVAVNGA